MQKDLGLISTKTGSLPSQMIACGGDIAIRSGDDFTLKVQRTYCELECERTVCDELNMSEPANGCTAHWQAREQGAIVGDLVSLPNFFEVRCVGF